MPRSSKLVRQDSLSDLRGQIRKIEANLLDQGSRLYPATRTGERARYLWLEIRPHLLRGGSVQIAPSGLGLTWHRQALKRARDTLVEMGLIRPSADGLYVLGRSDPLDELTRDQFLELKLVEGVLAALGGLMGKSNTRKRS